MPRWQPHTLTLQDNKPITYYRTGSDYPTILLAHGITDNALCWAPLVYRLQHEFDVVFYDAYGHGGSIPVSKDHHFDLVSDLSQLIERLGLKSPILLGHSMGGHTIAGYVAQGGDAKAIILEDPAWLDELDLLPPPLEMAQGLREIQRMPLANIVSLYQRENLQWSAEEAIRMAIAREQMDLRFFEYVQFRDWAWRSAVRQIKSPMLLLTGNPEKGGIVTPEIAEDVLFGHENRQHEHFHEAGHSIRRDQPARYYHVIRSFIETLY